jgi:ABC-type antimicrobial peptide transport system permease subunit
MGIKILQGRDFMNTPGDSTAILLNKAATVVMNIKNPVGMIVRERQKNYTVVGVIDNVVIESPYKPVDPMLIYYMPEASNVVTIRLNKGVPPQKAINFLKTIFAKYDPNTPFDYQFVDQEFGKKFLAEQLIGNIIEVFAGLAIFICCIGLAALVSFTIEKRFKEIGVRKVLGASVPQLLLLISGEFVKLVAIAFLVATPLTWWLMYKWLENYDYRITISIWLFGSVGVVIVLLAVAVVSLNTIKAALANPVKSLRSE